MDEGALVAVAHLAYGWMPTVLHLESIKKCGAVMVTEPTATMGPAMSASAQPGCPTLFDALLVMNELVNYCFLFLKSPNGIGALLKGGAGVGRPNINAPTIEAIPVPLPPLAEQAEIIAEVERRLTVLDALSQTLIHELKRAERLRQSILHRAFTGRLVPQDATDEPAAALLARLRETPVAPAKTKAGRGRKTVAQQTTLGL